MLYELISTKPNECELRAYEEAAPGDEQLMVKVDFGSPKHGTELNHFRGTDPFITMDFDEEYQLFLKDESKTGGDFFMKPGNMWVGKIQQMGQGVSGFKIGQRIAGYGPLRNTHILHAKDALIMPESMTWKEAVCYDPVQFALGGLRDSKMRMGDTVAVFGLGAIGLIAAQMARRAGAAFVAVIDPIARRREVALKCGADMALDPNECDVGLELKKATFKRGVDIAIESSGSYSALQAAMRGIIYAGNISVVGWYGECTGKLDFGKEAHFNQPNLIFSRACSDPNRLHGWSFERICEASWDMLCKGDYACEDIVDPVVPFAEVASAYCEINTSPELSVKLGVDFSEEVTL